MYKYTNKNDEFLKESDLVIFYNEKPQNFLKNVAVIGGESEFSKVDIKKTSKKLPLLFARLAYVFEIYDENLKEIEEFEDFVEILKGVRVKKEIKNHDTTLEEVAGFLYLVDNAKKISVIIGEIPAINANPTTSGTNATDVTIPAKISFFVLFEL